MKPLLLLLIPVSALAIAASASAQTFVQWGPGGNIVTATANALTVSSITASTATSVNPAANANGYYDGDLSPAGRNAVFYGSVYNDPAKTPSATTRLQITHASPNDFINFDFSGTASNHTQAGLVFWQKSDFQNGFDTAAVDFADVEFNIVTGVNAARNPQQNVYLVVRL